MSELKKDYTTPEQSKKLLELGIPIESANIVYYHTPDSWHDPYLITEKRQIENLKSGKGLPCWSVGRLIEIFETCTSTKFERWSHRGVVRPLLEDCIEHIKFALNPDTIMKFDFSKLEEV